jgi:hypothetical protein
VAWNFSDIPEGGLLSAPSSFTGISATQGSYDYVVTFRNGAGSETNTGSRPLDPISCGPVTVNVTGLNYTPNEGWRLGFTPSNPCPAGTAAPTLVVTPPSGCAPYPQPLRTQCDSSSLDVNPATGNIFGYTIAVQDPPGFRFDGLVFSPAQPRLAEPSPRSSFEGVVRLLKVERPSATSTAYNVTLESKNMATPPTIVGCTRSGGPDSMPVFQCVNSGDASQENRYTDFRIVPGGSVPRGPYQPLPSTCGGLADGWSQTPAGSTRPPQGSSCTLGLRVLLGPPPSTTLPPDNTCPGFATPAELAQARIDHPDWFLPGDDGSAPGSTYRPEGRCFGAYGPSVVLPFGLIGGAGLVLYAFGSPNRRRRWGSSR